MDDTMNRIGIMGGTFNPIHNGHLYLAKEACKQFALGQILFIPSGTPYMKDLNEVLPGKLRAAMTTLAIQDYPQFSMSTMEIEKKGNTYTYETLETLGGIYQGAELFFILGADSLFAIEDWRCPERIFLSCRILAAIRNDISTEKIEEQASYLRQKFDADILIMQTDVIDISSSLIRERIQEGRSVKGLIPDIVYDYIFEHELYHANAGTR